MSTDPEVTTARPPLDAVAAHRWLLGCVPQAWGGEAWLHGEVARRMESRLQWMRHRPESWVDWSPSLGGWDAGELLPQRYPQARRVSVEPAPRRLERTRQQLSPPAWQFWKPTPRVLAQAPTGQAHMLWSNMALHAHPDPQSLLQQWHEALAVDGFVMFSCLGPDSMRELRDVYARCGWPPPTHAFTDMHDWGDLLIQAGFAEPVMDMERITLTYSSAQSLLNDLRALGRNLHEVRHPGLRGRGWHHQLVSALEGAGPQALPESAREAGSTSAGSAAPRIPLTFEIIYGHALKPTPRAPVSAQTQVRLQDFKAMLGQRPNQA